jgi:hypothetical protein
MTLYVNIETSVYKIVNFSKTLRVNGFLQDLNA